MKSSKFGIYVHIPHCSKICPYCDFTKYEAGKILSMDNYILLLEKEIRSRASIIGPRIVDTLYFGGGTPSLFSPEQLRKIIDILLSEGFQLQPHTEITLEINPGTRPEISHASELEKYRKIALINRWSVGVQSFQQHLLRIAGREHTADDARALLHTLKEKGWNYSFDLLHSLPQQSLSDLQSDLTEVVDIWSPPHISPYVLTVGPYHPLMRGRPDEETQVEMWNMVERILSHADYEQYELSNWAKPGFESQHNQLYWLHDEYWGIGVSSHSYLKRGTWGTRFSNPLSLPLYIKEVDNSLSNQRSTSMHGKIKSFWPINSPDQYEELEFHQALTDFCHVRLRHRQGLSIQGIYDFTHEFNNLAAIEKNNFEAIMNQKIESAMKAGWIDEIIHDNNNNKIAGTFGLTSSGRLLSNQVFEIFTFLRDDLTSAISSIRRKLQT